jgi:hypothetical protein
LAGDEAEALAGGCSAYITKVRVLLAKVREYLALGPFSTGSIEGGLLWWYQRRSRRAKLFRDNSGLIHLSAPLFGRANKIKCLKQITSGLWFTGKQGVSGQTHGHKGRR